MHVLRATLFAVTASAHYVFPSIVNGNTITPAWQYVRQYPSYYTNSPVTDVNSLDIRCNVGGSTVSSNTSTVAAGSKIGFTASPNIYHPGPAQVYMAAVPKGSSVSTWDGSGTVWFKIYQDGPNFSSSGLTWPTDSATQVQFTIPSQLPAGDYLIRMEHIALHSASSAGGAQFYISCAQLTVTGGGSGTPSPLVSLPGAYSPTDPGLLINIYYPVPTSYTNPGPRVWPGT